MKETKNRLHERMILVLYVADNPYEAGAVCRLSERFGGVLMHPACSAREAMQWLSRHRADVVVTDFFLPDMDGIDLCRAIRAQTGMMIPCIVFSAADAAAVDARLQNSPGASGDLLWYQKKDGPLRSQIVALMDLVSRAAESTDGYRMKRSGRV